MEKPVEQGRSEHFSITLPSFVVADLDEMRKPRGLSRSAFIRELVLMGIERTARIRELELSESVA